MTILPRVLVRLERGLLRASARPCPATVVVTSRVQAAHQFVVVGGLQYSRAAHVPTNAWARLLVTPSPWVVGGLQYSRAAPVP